MRSVPIILSIACLAAVAAAIAAAGTSPSLPPQAAEKAAAAPSWKSPVSAGVWYPADGPIPDAPVRYYRVRCWPGCHSGSALGKYPDKALNDMPIFPTSTVGEQPKSNQSR